MTRARSVAIAAAAAAAIGCTAAPSEAATSICLVKTRAAIAKDLSVKSSTIGTSESKGGNGMPQCNYQAGHIKVVVNVDNGPQAAWRLMRKVVEATQIFGAPPPGWKAPIGLYGLGAYASWFINLDTLMANNHTRTQILSATIGWRHAKQKAQIQLARAAIVPYIHAAAKAETIPVSGY